MSETPPPLDQPEPPRLKFLRWLVIVMTMGETLSAYTKGSDWGAIVTRDEDGTERIHILDPENGEIRQTVTIDP